MNLKILAILIFLFAMGLRLWNLNMMGRVWDEQSFLEKGYSFIELTKQKDFNNPFWYEVGADHPPLPFYFYGLTAYADFIRFDKNAKPGLTAWPTGVPVFHYDLTISRLLSAVISSLAIVMVFFIGARYFSLFTGIVSAIILSMLPHFLGLSQLVVLESWIMFSFTACVLFYLLYLEKNQRRYLILTGIMTGVTLMTKQSNLIIFVFFLVTYLMYRRMTVKKDITFRHLFVIFLISGITSLVILPMPLFHLPEFITYTYNLWFKDSGRIPELLFGRHMGAPFFFYIVATFVTTPVVILLLGFVGGSVALANKKKWIYVAILIWFFVPFLMSFFHVRQHMIRYIIQFYAPLSILAAIGLEYYLGRFKKNTLYTYAAVTMLTCYLGLILVTMTPYYLAYFNEFVGGTKFVYEKKLFFIGWFGEGLKRPGIYIAEHAKKNARIGMALNPNTTLYKVSTLHYENFDQNKKYDYVVVNYFNIIRIGFDESVLDKEYTVVYRESAGGADIARVYKRKTK